MANEQEQVAPADRLEAEVAELRDQLLRALAEQENMRRRAAREREEAVAFAAFELIRDLLPSVDNLRRAIESVPEEDSRRGELLGNLLAGVAGSERAMLDAFEKHGIRSILPAAGEPFDPTRHQAMYEVEDSAWPPGSVAKVMQPGFAYRGRLLRPALVGMVKADDQPVDDESDDAGGGGRANTG